MYSHINLFFQSCVSTTSAVLYCNVVNSETKHLYHARISWNNTVHNKINPRQHLNITTTINIQNCTKTLSAITLQEAVQENITKNVTQFNAHAHHAVNFLIHNY